MEIITVQQANQNKTLPELRTINSAIWIRMLEDDRKRFKQTVSFFHTKSLRRILPIFWPNTISNEDLLRQSNQESISTILIRRRLKQIGHVIRRDQNSITRTALHWTPGKRKRRRPQNTWGRTVEGELKSLNNYWGTIEKITKDRQKWRTFVAALWHTGQLVLKKRSVSIRWFKRYS